MRLTRVYNLRFNLNFYAKSTSTQFVSHGYPVHRNFKFLFIKRIDICKSLNYFQQLVAYRASLMHNVVFPLRDRLCLSSVPSCECKGYTLKLPYVVEPLSKLFNYHVIRPHRFESLFISYYQYLMEQVAVTKASVTCILFHSNAWL